MHPRSRGRAHGPVPGRAVAAVGANGNRRALALRRRMGNRSLRCAAYLPHTCRAGNPAVPAGGASAAPALGVVEAHHDSRETEAGSEAEQEDRRHGYHSLAGGSAGFVVTADNLPYADGM